MLVIVKPLTEHRTVVWSWEDRWLTLRVLLTRCEYTCWDIAIVVPLQFNGVHLAFAYCTALALHLRSILAGSAWHKCTQLTPNTIKQSCSGDRFCDLVLQKKGWLMMCMSHLCFFPLKSWKWWMATNPKWPAHDETPSNGWGEMPQLVPNRGQDVPGAGAGPRRPRLKQTACLVEAFHWSHWSKIFKNATGVLDYRQYIYIVQSYLIFYLVYLHNIYIFLVVMSEMTKGGDLLHCLLDFGAFQEHQARHGGTVLWDRWIYESQRIGSNMQIIQYITIKNIWIYW